MGESPFPEIAHPQQRAFLAAFRETGNVRLACEVAKVGRSSHYRWLEEHPDYREAFHLAKECAADVLEAAAHRRAVTGWDEPAGWYKGKAGGMVRKYSDLLLIFLLKGIRPDKYKDRMELRGAFANLDVSRLPDELVARLARGEHPMSVLAGWASEAQARGEPVGEILGLEPGKTRPDQRDLDETKAFIERDQAEFG